MAKSSGKKSSVSKAKKVNVKSQTKSKSQARGVTVRRRSLEGESIGPNSSLVKMAEISYSGPFPHPKMLKEYGEVGVDVPDRVMTLVEKEQSGRHAKERHRLWNETLLIVASTIVACSAIAGAFLSAVFFQQYVLAGILAFSGIIVELLRIWRSRKPSSE